jgi:E-phenylitaconyl-CoA hydratase
LVSVEDLIPTVDKLAARIAGHAPLAVRTVKEIAVNALDQTLEQSLRFGDQLRWIIGQTEDAKEGPRAFAEKRDAEFKGR